MTDARSALARLPLLLVTADDGLATHVRALLASCGQRDLTVCADDAGATGALSEQTFAVLLLDTRGPLRAGTLIPVINTSTTQPYLPIIAFAADAAGTAAAFDDGADDVLVLPLDDDEFLRRLRVACRHHTLQAAAFEQYRAADSLSENIIATSLELLQERESSTAAQERLRQQIQAKTDQLLHAERLATIGTMAAQILHECNNPVAVIKGSAEFQRTYLPQARARCSTAIAADTTLKPLFAELEGSAADGLEAVARLERFLTSLRTLTRRGQDEHGSVDPGELVRRTLQLLTRLVPPGVTLRWPDAEIARMTVRGSAPALMQLLINLVQNAAQACAANRGTVTVTRGRSGSRAVLTVADTGSGMPPDMLARIWEPFYTTKPEGQGTGLGLAIVRDIVKQHDGEITVSSAPGRGTVFTVYLPLAA